ncbi:MAG: peptidylprolyl isomerase [Draconibacterium sp.]
MRNSIFFILLLFVFPGNVSAQDLPKVKIKTQLGTITVEIDTVRAPITAKNFLEHVKKGTYEDAVFYRVVRLNNQPGNKVKIEVVQGGLSDDKQIDRIHPIVHETTKMTGIKHKNGTLSMARNSPGTASTEFFICIGDQPELDFGGARNPDGQGFAAFGQVISGMETVREIQQQNDTTQYLVEPVKVELSLIK